LLYRFERRGGGWVERGRILARPDVFQVGPLLSPDGRRILFAEVAPGRSGEIFLAELAPGADRSWPPSCRPRWISRRSRRGPARLSMSMPSIGASGHTRPSRHEGGLMRARALSIVGFLLSGCDSDPVPSASCLTATSVEQGDLDSCSAVLLPQRIDEKEARTISSALERVPSLIRAW
jgi:hypothetical protein